MSRVFQSTPTSARAEVANKGVSELSGRNAGTGQIHASGPRSRLDITKPLRLAVIVTAK